MSELNTKLDPTVEAVLDNRPTPEPSADPKDSKLKITLVGIGNAGCQAVDLAKKHNHTVFAINSSAKDLDEHLVDKSIGSFIIGNHRGAGKDRRVAKQFMTAELARLLDYEDFVTAVEPADVVVVTGSCAGGTGSGAGPLLANRIQAKWPNKIVLFFGILPKNNESAQAQYNSLECMNEVTSAQLNMGYMLADLHAYEDLPNEEAFRKCAAYIVDCLNVIRGDCMTRSPYGMIDENDMLNMLATPGYIAIYHRTGITQKDLDSKTTQSIMISTIMNGEAAPMQRDKVVRNMGVVVNTTDQQDDPCKAGNFEELENYVGHPLATFMNYATDAKRTAEIALIFTGMSKPYDRMQDCTEIAKKCQALFADRDTGEMADELREVMAIKESRRNNHRDQILGVATKAVSNDAVLNDIPDIFGDD